MFQNGAWNRTYTQIEIFDDRFTDENVCSGLEVSSGHRQNLHELILGAQGLALHRRLTTVVEAIEIVNGRIQNVSRAIPTAEREGLSVDEFCNLPLPPNVDELILAEERLSAATRQEHLIRSAAGFDALHLPEIDLNRIQALLRRDLPTLEIQALTKVRNQLATLGERGERWVAIGMDFVTDSERDTCPFCALPLESSSLIAAYRGYFSEEYAHLKEEIVQLLSSLERQNGGDARGAFERSARILQERRQFWQAFIDLPEMASDSTALVNAWRTAYEALRIAIERKQVTPLDQQELTEEVLNLLRTHSVNVQALNELETRITDANSRIGLIRERLGTADSQTVAGNLARLRASRNRHSAQLTQLCNEYLAAKADKVVAEQEREDAKAALDQHRNTIFPSYQNAINHYLECLNAGFRVDRVMPTDTRGGPTCNYCLVVNNTHIPVTTNAGQNHEPSFRTTLSSGDRNTLALAFFFAALDQKTTTDLSQTVVVIDDPISSLDDHRTVDTTQVLRRLGQRVEQLVVLSHSKSFLCRLSDGMDVQARTALKIERDGTGSTLAMWDVDMDSITEHDRRHAILTTYLQNGPSGNQRDVASSLRSHMESYLRVTCPEHFPPGAKLGNFYNLCEARYGLTSQILDRQRIDELRDIKEFSNQYHHDTNPAWETEVINDAQLFRFISRTLKFTRP